MGSLDEINPALLPPMARMKAIYIPNIASIAPPQMDNTFPSALRGLVGEEEHQSVIEEVNEELRSGLCLSEFENQEGQMERMRGPSIGLGVVWLVGLGLLGLGLEVGNGFLLAMGLVVVLPIFFILLGAGGYWVYLTSKQAKMCQDIEERVHDLSERRFSNRGIYYHLTLDDPTSGGCLTILIGANPTPLALEGEEPLELEGENEFS